MSTIVQINFSFNEPLDAYEEGALAAAPMFVDLDGLLWKTWLVNEEHKEAGGIYLFATKEQAEKYAASEIVEHLKSVRENMEVKVFAAMEAPGLLTRAPLTGN